VLEAMRIVIVEHMDQVLSEALVLTDPDSIFGTNRQRPLEYRRGKVYDPNVEAPSGGPTPTVDAPATHQ